LNFKRPIYKSSPENIFFLKELFFELLLNLEIQIPSNDLNMFVLIYYMYAYFKLLKKKIKNEFLFASFDQNVKKKMHIKGFVK
jgi:hypothetical protein